MQLCLMRHGKAEPLGVLHTLDQSRPLTEKGMTEIRRVSSSLYRMGARFDMIFTSPLLRARQTAKIVAMACDYAKEPEMDETLSGRFNPEIMATRLEAVPDAATVLLVGHSPSLNKLIAYLISSDETTKIDLQPGCLAWVEIHHPTSRSGILHWLIPTAIWPD